MAPTHVRIWSSLSATKKTIRHCIPAIQPHLPFAAPDVPDEKQMNVGWRSASAGSTVRRSSGANVQQWRQHMLESGLPSQRPRRQSAIAFLPFSHIYGYFWMQLRYKSRSNLGITTTVVPHIKHWHMNKFKYRPDELALVPPIALMLVKDPRVSKYDLSSVRKILDATEV
jgi:hypothetical protein